MSGGDVMCGERGKNCVICVKRGKTCHLRQAWEIM